MKQGKPEIRDKPLLKLTKILPVSAYLFVLIYLLLPITYNGPGDILEIKGNTASHLLGTCLLKGEVIHCLKVNHF